MYSYRFTTSFNLLFNVSIDVMLSGGKLSRRAEVKRKCFYVDASGVA